MAREMIKRLTVAGAVLAVTLATGIAAAQAGHLRLGAGDVDIVVGRGEQGLFMDIAGRKCPPQCGFDFQWQAMGRPLARAR